MIVFIVVAMWWLCWYSRPRLSPSTQQQLLQHQAKFSKSLLRIETANTITMYGDNNSQQNPYATSSGMQYGYTNTGSKYSVPASPAGPPNTYNSNLGYAPGNPNVVFGTAVDPTTDSGYNGAPVVGVPLYPEASNNNSSPNLKKFVIQGYQDLWAGVLFAICFFITFVIGVVNFSKSFNDLKEYNKQTGILEEDALSAATLVGGLFAIVAFCVALAVIALFIFFKFPQQAIIVSWVASCVLSLIAGIVSCVQGAFALGVIALLLSVLGMVALFFMRHHIPFSALLLKVSTSLIIKYKGTIVVNFLLVAVATVFCLFWAAEVYPSFEHANDKDASAGDAMLMIFALLTFYWTMQVLFNMIHVTVSGVAATWYFCGEANVPRNPTVASFKRASTTSFGSICFGSLLVAIIQVMRAIARSQRDSEHPFIACIVECILGCIESLVRYFNRYAFVYVAIYGNSYTEAARKTFELAQNCAYEALWNDNLIGTTLTMTALGMSFLSFLVFYVAFSSAAFGAIAFFICLAVHIQLFRVIDSTVVTLFVCFAEEPNLLAQNNPELYAAIHQATGRTEQA